jgi:hypothetical protein
MSTYINTLNICKSLPEYGVNMTLEKTVPHYSLTKLKRLIEEGRYKFTFSSKKTLIEDFSITTEEALETILKLTGKDLYKSMQSHENVSLWQDVYHKNIGKKTAYIKLQINMTDNAIIISFKKK